MEPFQTLRGKLALLDWNEVNTDLIIPARFLKRIERTGYGPLLFADKRYREGTSPQADNPDEGGVPDPAFPLNTPHLADATILVVGKNFGCGSSREHAVWAVAQAGYRVLIAPGLHEGFADIFEANAFNNGLLPIELPDDQWKAVARAASSVPGAEATINLLHRTITVHFAEGPDLSFPFNVPDNYRNRLLKGIDVIDETLLLEDQIRAHERSTQPWTSPRHA